MNLNLWIVIFLPQSSWEAWRGSTGLWWHLAECRLVQLQASRASGQPWSRLVHLNLPQVCLASCSQMLPAALQVTILAVTGAQGKLQSPLP